MERDARRLGGILPLGLVCDGEEEDAVAETKEGGCLPEGRTFAVDVEVVVICGGSVLALGSLLAPRWKKDRNIETRTVGYFISSSQISSTVQNFF